MANGLCKVCGNSLMGKKEYCPECYKTYRREQNRVYWRKLRAEMRKENERMREIAKRTAPPPKMSIADISLYAKEHGITYGKAVLELERG